MLGHEGGDVKIPPPLHSTAAAIERRVERVPFSGCWIWVGQTNGVYGQLYSRGKVVGAHRLSWMAHRGEIPDGLFVCHHCDVPLCVNPDHLFLGTCRDNAADMVRKGRSPAPDHRGDRNPMFGRKQSAETVRRILENRRSFARDAHPRATITSEIAEAVKQQRGKTTAKETAAMIGVSFHVVRNIWRGHAWR